MAKVSGRPVLMGFAYGQSAIDAESLTDNQVKEKGNFRKTKT